MRSIRTGLVIAAVLGVSDIATVGMGGPPLAIAIISAVFGVITLAALRPAWRGNRRGLTAVVVTRALSALATVPAFFGSDVAAGIRVLAGVLVLAAIVSIVLVAPALRDRPVVAS